MTLKGKHRRSQEDAFPLRHFRLDYFPPRLVPDFAVSSNSGQDGLARDQRIGAVPRRRWNGAERIDYIESPS
jgi:hypothetical protein